MIKGTHRFHGRSSLGFVYKQGQTVRGPLVALRFVNNERRQTYRLAVVVSRKVSKSAVVRNRLRRRLYEIVRTNAPSITGPYDLVFSIYDETVSNLSHANLQKLVMELLTKAKVTKPGQSTETKRAIVVEKETNK